MPQTLLLVEDSRLAAEGVRLACRRLGIRLRRAETLEAAHLHLRVYRPEIALIDPGLPDGSGLSLIAALHRQAGRPDRIVGISGDPGLADPCLNAGADAFVEKPLILSQHLTLLLGPGVMSGAEPLGVSPAKPFRQPATEGGDAAARVSAQGAADCSGTGTGHLRNMGGDPMALSDDLRRARRLLLTARGPAEIVYAAQFLDGVARCASDDTLLRAARKSHQSGNAAPLLAVLADRTHKPPAI
ncbi:MAG: response regulator [Pararhodobacter sp.]